MAKAPPGAGRQVVAMCTKDIALKAACADNFYYPQEWNPDKGISLDAYQRSKGFEHHLGKQRTKNQHKGILQIRFEMPFKVQCLRCGTFIGQGTRYDADKKKIGMYFSTPLFEFAMRCNTTVAPEKSADGKIFCNQRLVVRTDPKNDAYEMYEGLRQKEETFSAQDSETIELPNNDPEVKRQMANDPMFKVERTIRDSKREKSDKERVGELMEVQEEMEDDYAVNCSLRRGNRERKRAEKAAEELARREHPNFHLPLEPRSAEDALEAKRVAFRTDHDRLEASSKRAATRAAPIFKRKEDPITAAINAKAALLAVKRRKVAHHMRIAQHFAAAA